MFLLPVHEYISAANGKSGHAGNGEPWMGDCVQRLELKVTNWVTGLTRTFGKSLSYDFDQLYPQLKDFVGPFGTAKGLDESSTTMIHWSGSLIAFAGSADNKAAQVGLHGIAFVKKAD